MDGGHNNDWLKGNEQQQSDAQPASDNSQQAQPGSNAPQISPNLPEISTGPALSDLFGSTSATQPTPIAEKRASNVARLAEEHAKLNAELRAMSERIEAAEKKRAEIESARIARQKELKQKEQRIMEPPSS